VKQDTGYRMQDAGYRIQDSGFTWKKKTFLFSFLNNNKNTVSLNL